MTIAIGGLRFHARATPPVPSGHLAGADYCGLCSPKKGAKTCWPRRRVGSRRLRLEEGAEHLRPSLLKLDILLEPAL
jgi:hypothetical protein